MIHGGSQTGSGWISTPDGRDGWATYFLRHGYAVYVVDQVARGRSPYIAEVYGAPRAQTREYAMQRFSTSEKYNLWPQAKLHTQWPGNGEPGDPAFDNYFASNVPSMDNRAMQSDDECRRARGAARPHRPFDRAGAFAIGAVRLAAGAGASGAGQGDRRRRALRTAGARRGRARARRASAWISTRPRRSRAPRHFRDDPRLKRYGPTDIPLDLFAAGDGRESPLAFVQQDKAEAPDLARCWRQKEPARKLVAVGDRPILYLAAEASFYAPYNHCTVGYLEAGGRGGRPS